MQRGGETRKNPDTQKGGQRKPDRPKRKTNPIKKEGFRDKKGRREKRALSGLTKQEGDGGGETRQTKRENERKEMENRTNRCNGRKKERWNTKEKEVKYKIEQQKRFRCRNQI